MTRVVLGLILLLCLAIIVYRQLALTKKSNGARSLPGPKGYPIIGNLLEFPRSFAWLKFKDWSEIYGPVYKLDVLGTTHVVVSEQRIADELLTTRGATYSDRGSLQMLALITKGGDLVGSPMNDYWRKGRKFAAAMTGPSISTQYEPFLEREVKRMVIDMVRDSSKYEFWFERVSTAVSTRQLFGEKCAKNGDVEYHTKQIVIHNRHIERTGSSGAYLVNLFPPLNYLPEALAPFKREAKQVYARDSAYFFSLLQQAIQRYEDKIPEDPKSFARSWLDKDDRWGMSFTEAAYVLGTLFGGATGTTSGTMRSFCLAMCHHPEWMEKLNQELDKVVGPDRPPTFSDYPNLQVVRAVVKETLRWRPIVPTNVPHRAIKCDIFEGYKIPKGALIHANQWAIHRDPVLYPEGETFNPARWLSNSYPTFKEPLEQFPNIKRYSSFGFGRRICPGFEIAERSLFMQIASLAWACKISKKVVDGKEVPVPYCDYTDGAQSFPKPFTFEVKPRDAARLAMLEQDC